MLFHLFDPLNQVVTGDKLFEIILGNPGIEKFEHLLAVLLITPLGSKDIITADNLGCFLLQVKLSLTEICTFLIKEFEAGSVSIFTDMTVLEVISMLDTLFPDLCFLVVYLVYLVLAGRKCDEEDEEKDCKKEHQEKVSHYIFIHS